MKDEVQEAAAVLVPKKTDSIEESSSMLTNEEDLEVQRDIAVKVILYFLLFIGACFGILYIYHAMY